MRVDDEVRGQLATRFEVLLPHLDERQQRMALACEARLLEHRAWLRGWMRSGSAAPRCAAA